MCDSFETVFPSSRLKANVKISFPEHTISRTFNRISSK